MDNDIDSVKKRALRILGRRSFSEKEMFKRLVDKGESEEASEETVRWLVELGYLNDDDYAASIVNHYTASGYGEARIKDELYRRGIPREMWDEKLSAVKSSESDDIPDPAVEYLQKKLRGSTDKDDLRRASDALVRRGFSYDEAREAVNRYLEKE